MLYMHETSRFWNVEEQLPGSYTVSEDMKQYHNSAYLLLNAEQAVP